MKMEARLGELEAKSSVTAASVHTPARPPTRALEIMLDALQECYLRPPPEHPDMPQVIARELLSRDDASSEARETAWLVLAGEHGR